MSRIDTRRLPRDFTGCEVYRGYVVAISSAGSYAVFNTEGNGMYRYLKGGFSARRAIDLEHTV